MKSYKEPTYQELEKRIYELKKDENRFYMLLQASEDMITIHKPNGEYIYYNAPTCYAITPKDIVGKMPNDLFDKDVSNILLNAFEKVKRTGRSKTIEVFFDWLGEKRWFSEYIFPFKNADGEVVEIVKVCRDIHKNKIAEQEIEIQNKALIENKKELDLQNEKLYELNNALNHAQKLSHVGSWQWDMATDKVEWSDEMYNIYGVTKESFHPSNENVTNIVLPEDLYKLEQGIQALLVDEMFNPFEFRIKRPSGEIRNLFIIALTKNSQESIFGVTKDITEQKKIEEDNLKTKLRLEKISNDLNEAQKIAHVGSWLFDPAIQKNEWSDEMFHIWGFDSKKDAPEHHSIIKRIHTDDLDLFNHTIDKAANLGVSYDIELRICLPNDEQKTIRTICKPVLGDNGKVISLTGTNQDITTQKLFEEAQVKHQRLKAIGEMSSSIAHDFNNSLQQMMGNLEIIKFQKHLSDVALERLNSIGTIMSDVAGRVNALQKFGDTEHDDKDIKLIDFNTLIEESLNQSRPLWKDGMEKKGLKINVITDFQDIPKISCNNGELKSAVYNLIKNSIEAMPEGGDLIIKTSSSAEHVFATFTDTGLGMDEEVRLKVFEPFFTTKGFRLGRGLGMSGVYSILKKYSGNIVVKSSELLKGSTFEIAFPIGQQDETKVVSKNVRKEKKSFNVLWVDDDHIITEDIGELVELIGHKCTIANSGKNALEYLHKNTYDIVFTDIGMPEMNGLELIDAIRNNFGNKIKIVTVTGWAIDKKAKEEHDIDFVLQKPFTLDDLESLLMEL